MSLTEGGPYGHTHKHHSVLVVLSLFILPISAATADITTGLVSHWMLDDGAGSTALDSVGNNHGTLQGDAAWAEGYVGGAILLDGAGDYIDCGNSATFNITDAITLAAWVQAKGDFAYPDWSGIIMRGGPNIDTFALYYHKGSERLGFKTTGTNPNWLATATGATTLVVYLRGKTTNKPTTLYLSIEDASSQSARTEPFDQAMVTRAQWTEWRIPISLFTALGVDMTGVKQVKIGVYDTVGAGSATGTLYIDDIRVIKVTP